ncbi:MAG: NAD(P)H-dependent oxidoreductase [Sphaerochaetaceae bacterium]|jgi:NAD(P)H-dependent FMN reductase|nr:NAD(P)H-dependent oxidoreductase [Sphaerochaetaceae bacterium]
MSNPRIGIIISSTRKARLGEQAADYLMKIASKRDDLSFEVIDLRNYPMPFFNELGHISAVPTSDPIARKWQKKLAEFDGFIFVTAEYNDSIPGVLKNALDYAYLEWIRKPAAFFAYGSLGGSRAVHQLRQICIELQMAPLRIATHLQGVDFFSVMEGKKEFKDFPYLEPLITDMLDNLAWWTRALKHAREA